MSDFEKMLEDEMSDFEKILEVTRMAKKYGDYIQKTRIKDVLQGVCFIGKGLIQTSANLRRISLLFPNQKQRDIVLKWYLTVYEMRSTHV